MEDYRRARYFKDFELLKFHSNSTILNSLELLRIYVEQKINVNNASHLSITSSPKPTVASMDHHTFPAIKELNAIKGENYRN